MKGGDQSERKHIFPLHLCNWMLTIKFIMGANKINRQCCFNFDRKKCNKNNFFRLSLAVRDVQSQRRQLELFLFFKSYFYKP